MQFIVSTVIITFVGTATTPAVLPELLIEPVPVVPPKSIYAVAALFDSTAAFRKTSLPEPDGIAISLSS